MYYVLCVMFQMQSDHKSPSVTTEMHIEANYAAFTPGTSRELARYCVLIAAFAYNKHNYDDSNNDCVANENRKYVLQVSPGLSPAPLPERWLFVFAITILHGARILERLTRAMQQLL